MSRMWSIIFWVITSARASLTVELSLTTNQLDSDFRACPLVQLPRTLAFPESDNAVLMAVLALRVDSISGLPVVSRPESNKQKEGKEVEVRASTSAPLDLAGSRRPCLGVASPLVGLTQLTTFSRAPLPHSPNPGLDLSGALVLMFSYSTSAFP